MKTEAPVLSENFQRLYCNAGAFEGFSALHPVDFKRVLPFPAGDPVVDDSSLLAAEAAHLADPSEMTRLAVVDAFAGCNLLSASDAVNLKPVIDYYDADFFELIGEVYANAGMFICALRWHRELIAVLEAQRPDMASDRESVYGGVGYCLYSLGLYPEAISWSKSCIGPGQTADTVNRGLINYEASAQGGSIRGIERSSNQTHYTIGALDPGRASQLTPRLKQAMNSFAPFQEVHVDWISSGAPVPEIQTEGYPFQAERDDGVPTRHRMNLIFALCGQADTLTAKGFVTEAKRLLIEASLLEPRAEFVQERLKAVR
jgi:hypothetical protein